MTPFSPKFGNPGRSVPQTAKSGTRRAPPSQPDSHGPTGLLQPIGSVVGGRLAPQPEARRLCAALYAMRIMQHAANARRDCNACYHRTHLPIANCGAVPRSSAGMRLQQSDALCRFSIADARVHPWSLAIRDVSHAFNARMSRAGWPPPCRSSYCLLSLSLSFLPGILFGGSCGRRGRAGRGGSKLDAALLVCSALSRRRERLRLS